MPCHWIRDGDGTEVLIPECYGGAHDPKECTCEVRGSELDQAREALRKAEERIARMVDAARQQNERYTQTFNMNRQLRARIIELESQKEEKA